MSHRTTTAWAISRFLARGAHPWLTHDSFVRMDRALLSLVSKLREGLAARPPVLFPQARASAATIGTLQAALCSSRHTLREIKRALLDQGFSPLPGA